MDARHQAEREIRSMIDRETAAWDACDAGALVELFHPDTVWPWPPHATSHDPINWVMPLGRFDRCRWRCAWEDHFARFELVHNRRDTIRIEVSAELDAAFAVVDVDTLWRNRASEELQHWLGRACKVYTKVDARWFFIHQTGLLSYG